MPSYLINEIPGIQKMRYLELGVFDGHHFSAIQSEDKVSVDIKYNPTYLMTTNEFFRQVHKDYKWDIIYIDADHDCKSILRDFNNSVDHLSSLGSVFLHDLHPDNAGLTQPQFCGTGYIFLDLLRRTGYPNLYTLDSDYGVSFIYKPTTKLLEQDLNLQLSYNQFISSWRRKYNLYAIEDMKCIIERYYHE